MREIFLAFLAIAVIAVGSKVILDRIGFSASETSAGNAVRLDP